ncbi:hypothetical protein BAUCODRAFT_28971 [Baudoinia panamericana UAMH 10762]|uniref:PHD-type domain-containing protein n=1 Tax=Baudoinia panamericana (strain UAMH 10762) TaxID=717646 RepID=M2NM90_BAUPA|nr:uncharacterized protein BAUCODRAFT_28971 [Baudoinia panamericana UAMH 10762]EMD00625.1 hypothetical protein BAUCODRAFT_28971 [Baudoinia panamericana UAMH 10762]
MAALAAAAAAPDYRAPSIDPDVQTTLSDFLTYTEHFPSHLTRALTLIEHQRVRAEQKIKLIHDHTTAYSIRPKLQNKPDPVLLRKEVSYALEEAERACRMAVEEATRLDETCRREARRLDTVTERLKAQPMPPSRDPTPEQQPLTSPNLKRERRMSMGMSMRADDAKPEKASRHLTDKAATKLRGRKIMVPGEVLPPPDPNAPLESISDYTSPRVSPPAEEMSSPNEKKTTPRPRSRTPKLPKTDRDRKLMKARGPRAPGQPGTNAHSAVAGISTSNALLALTAPPDDAVKGSRWLPWMKLTEFEMAKLRKRMKKNAIWVPSQTMVRRELKNLGRGVGGKEAAKQVAKDGGAAFVDEPNESDPTKVVVTGEETATMNAMLGPQIYADDEDADAELINRGMRLNEAKKLKRLRMLEEQALQAQIAREQGVEPPTEPKAASDTTVDVSKKRKRDVTPATTLPSARGQETPDPLSKPGPPPKKLKISTSTQGTKIPLAPAGVSSSPKSAGTRSSRRAATPEAARKPTLILKAGKAVSEEPPNRRASLRRGSNASLPTGTLLTSPLRSSTTVKPSGGGNRRSKRPAPGILAQTDDGDAKVGVSKRKAAPKRKGTGGAGAGAGAGAGGKSVNTSATDQTTTLQPAFEPAGGVGAVGGGGEDYIDPDEPRYCVCGNVSYGTMIACDNEDACEKEWFHLDCVGLEDLPPRRTKWYCPDCRKKLRLGVGTNGLVGRQVGR